MEFIRKLAKTKIGFFLRNKLNIRPIFINTSKLETNYSISDSFIWRNDNDIRTIFRYQDLFNYFYKVDNSCVELYFYNSNGDVIKKIKDNKIKLSNEINISKILSDYKKDYGSFNIFHVIEKKNIDYFSIRNSCYSGFSIKNNIPSFVHGNIPVYSKKFYEDDIQNNIVSTSILNNQIYRIQDNFKYNKFDKVEIFLTNPTNNMISIKFENKNYKIKKNGSLILNATNCHDPKLISDCYYLRPIIFKYKKDFIDVHHG